MTTYIRFRPELVWHIDDDEQLGYYCKYTRCGVSSLDVYDPQPELTTDRPEKVCGRCER